MKKIIIFLLCTIISTSYLFSQNKEIAPKITLSKDNIKGNVSKIIVKNYKLVNSFGELKKGELLEETEITYNERGQMRQKEFKSDGSTKLETCYYYNNGLIAEYHYLYVKNDGYGYKVLTEAEYHTYKYNSNNELEEVYINDRPNFFLTKDPKHWGRIEDANKKLVYNYENGKVTSIDKYVWNRLYSRTKRTYVSEDKYEDVEYGEDGDVISILAYQNGLKVYSYKDKNATNIIYDAQGNIIKIGIELEAPKGAKAVYNGQIIGETHDLITTITYDDKGNQSSIHEVYGYNNTNIIKMDYSDYKFDRIGNWTSRLTTVDSRNSKYKNSIEEREITYYSSTDSSNSLETAK